MNENTLHSTLLLLYQSARTGIGSARTWLYIPLCFYFIRSHTTHLKHGFSLYIPLCFYFIGEQAGHTGLSGSHFTFHFASTLSYIYSIRGWIFKTLHSTLLLLYPRVSPPRMSIRRSLHSTLLLLYPPFSRYGEMPWVYFTFHFASTLSPEDQWGAMPDHILYIPLCFYFILLPFLQP